jgi:hypothetical protein
MHSEWALAHVIALPEALFLRFTQTEKNDIMTVSFPAVMLSYRVKGGGQNEGR